MTNTPDIDLIRRCDLARKWKVAPVTIDAWERNDPTFPKRISINSRVVCWRVHEIESWLAKQHNKKSE